jgi:hypothetical protein
MESLFKRLKSAAGRMSLVVFAEILLFCNFHAAALGSQAVSISCEIEIIAYPEPDHPRQERREERRRKYFAEIITSTNEWSIYTQGFLANAEERHYFDGTNVYKSLRITKQMPQPTLTPGKPYMTSPSPDDGDIHVAIIPGDHPLDNMGVNIPWLAFCSGAYLRKPGRIIPKPAPVVRASPDAFGYLDKTIIFEDSLGLPRSVELYTSRAQAERGLDDPRISRRFDRETALADLGTEGSTVVRYSVEKYTNFLAWSIPTEFSLTQFRSGTNREAIPYVGFVGKVTSLAMALVPADQPFPGKIYWYKDLRFRHGSKLLDGIQYSDTNYSIRSTNDARLRQVFASAVKRSPGGITKKSRTVMFILIALFFFPLAAILIKKSREKHE